MSPSAPVLVHQQQGGGGSAVLVNFGWAAVADVDEYELQKSPDQTTWSLVSTYPGSVLGASDTASATNPFYRLIARNQWGDSPPSNVVQVVGAAPPAPVLNIA